MAEFSAIDAMAAGDAWQRQRKPFEPVTEHNAGGHGAVSKLCRASSIKRDRGYTISLSQDAVNALYPQGENLGASIGTMSGLVIDYLVRHGLFADVLNEAIAELEGQP